MQQIMRYLVNLLNKAADPAPSTLRHKIRRLFMRRSMRKVVRIGIPIFCVVSCVGLIVSDQRVHNWVGDKVSHVQDYLFDRPEFAIHTVSITGREYLSHQEILDVLAIPDGATALSLNPVELREKLQVLGWVKTAIVDLNQPGVVNIEIEERTPAAVWQSENKYYLIDTLGVPIKQLNNMKNWKDYLFLAGDKAGESLNEAQNLLTALTDVEAKVKAFVRVGQRRWNVILQTADQNELTLQLPSKPMIAINKFIEMEQENALLKRDISGIDMRDLKSIYLRGNSPDVFGANKVTVSEKEI